LISKRNLKGALPQTEPKVLKPLAYRLAKTDILLLNRPVKGTGFIIFDVSGNGQGYYGAGQTEQEARDRLHYLRNLKSAERHLADHIHTLEKLISEVRIMLYATTEKTNEV
jgi:hypothetical protein